MQEKEYKWYKPEIEVEGNQELQSVINQVIKLIEANLKNGSIFTDFISGDISKKPDLLDRNVLLLLLTGFPQELVRKYLKRTIREKLRSVIPKYPESFGSGPLFYPEIVCREDDAQSVSHLLDEDLHIFIKASEAFLVYHNYTSDPDLFMSDGFNILLLLSRFWSSYLSNSENQGDIKIKNVHQSEIQLTAVEILRLTLQAIGYLKAESSWLYEDLREQNKFSELKETSCWKKIIQKERSQKGRRVTTQYYFDVPTSGFVENELNGYIRMHLPSVIDGSADLSMLSKILIEVLFECLGFSVSDNHLSIKPQMPEGWKKCKACIHFRNLVVEVLILPSKLELKNLTNKTMVVKVNGFEVSLAGYEKEIF